MPTNINRKTLKIESKMGMIERFHNRLPEIIANPESLSSRKVAMREQQTKTEFEPTPEFIKDHEDMEKDELIRLLFQLVLRMNFLVHENDRLRKQTSSDGGTK